MINHDEGAGWKVALAIGGIVAVVGAWSLFFGGGQISTILSKVGASVPAGAGSGAGAAGGGTAEKPPSAEAAIFDLSRPDLLVIREGTIALEVEDIDAAVIAATHRLDALGAYVSASEQSGAGANATASVTFRVPADQWTKALDALRGVALRTVGAHTTSEDVTGQVVDLGARIANLRVTEAALQAIMAKADVVADVLDVQAELTTVRGEIEQATADLDHVKDQAAFSTLTADFQLKPAPAPVAAPKGGFDPAAEVNRATSRLTTNLQHLAGAGIWFAIVWLPILLGLVVIGGLGWLVVRRVRPRTAPPVPTAPA